MGEIILFFFFLAGGLSLGLARVVRLRKLREARTQEWIEFLRQDLSASTL
jgi:hypothetical protein